MPKTTRKLVLNQETLRNLSAGELRNIEGGLFTQGFFCKTVPSPTCPECPSPPFGINKPEDK